MSFPFLRKLRNKRIWQRILLERLSEPLHLNVLSLFAWFGGFRTRVYFDLVMRQPYAFGLLYAADYAHKLGLTRLTAVEFGVASGAGLVNICDIAAKVKRATGVEFEIYGFDSGVGMPPPLDYRDHPEVYGAGDFPMQDRSALERRLPSNAHLVIGDLGETVPDFVSRRLSTDAPLGFVVVDVDYYSSACAALRLLNGPPACYLPVVPMYVDDVVYDEHNQACGELLALEEFNRYCAHRRIEPFNLLQTKRLFKNAMWLKQMFILHVLDHAYRNKQPAREPVVLANPFLD